MMSILVFAKVLKEFVNMIISKKNVDYQQILNYKILNAILMD